MALSQSLELGLVIPLLDLVCIGWQFEVVTDKVAGMGSGSVADMGSGMGSGNVAGIGAAKEGDNEEGVGNIGEVLDTGVRLD